MANSKWKLLLSIHYLLFTIYLFRFSRPQRVEDAEGRARGVGEVCEGDGRGPALPEGGADGAHLFALPLVLRAQFRTGLAARGVTRGRAEVLDDERTARGGDPDA